jgi:hypothetical protein
MNMGDTVKITVSAWDAGCLPLLLEDRIKDVNREIRVIGDRADKGQIENMRKYLGQLEGCLLAVQTANQNYIKQGAAI